MKKIKQWQKIKRWLLAVSPSGIYRVGYYVSVWFSLTFVALIFFVPDRKYSVFILLGYFISYATFNFLSFALLIFLRRKK